MIITIESWHQLMELHHQKSIVEAKINHILFSLIEQLSDLIYKSVSGCTTEETLIEIDVEIKSIKERIEEIIKKRLAK